MSALDSWPHYISHYGYLAVFLLSLVEGPVVTIFAAFLVSQGVLDLKAVYATVVLGDLIGDLIYYAVGRWFIGRLPWRMGIRGRELRRRIDVLRSHIRAHAGRVLLFGKLTQSAGFAVLLAAGAARVRLDTFIFYNVVGTLPKSALFVVLGYFFGHFYNTLSGELRVAGMVGFAIFCLVTVPWIHRVCAARDPERLE